VIGAQVSPEEPEEEITVVDQVPAISPTTSPVYVIPAPEIQQRGVSSLAELLRTQPGFAINDFGFGADIHTGTFYRGASLNQSVILLNGRSIGSNVSTYHGATDLNSIPLDAIDRVELSSGVSTTLYGSEAFGGVINLVTKQGQGFPRLSGAFSQGSLGYANYRTGYGGQLGSVRFRLNYEEFRSENRYVVPVGAANRDAQGLLFNGDTAANNYYGSLAVDVDDRNTLSLDAYKVSSRRGLLYFGFPLQRDRLDHDIFNLGLTWNNKLGEGNDSRLSATIGYGQDYFNTYGPTQSVFYRQGILDSRAITARVEHQWQVNPSNNLRYGIDFRSSYLTGNVFSTSPSLRGLNELENRQRTDTALFALNTWNLSPEVQFDFGLRQNLTSEFGNYLNPSAGVRWAATPTLAVRGSWAAVQRNPGLDQLYVFDTVHNWLPNPDLKPETGSAWTIGLDAEITPGLTGQFTYFGNSLNDRLSIVAGRWANVGLVNTNGLEAALRWQLTPEWSTTLSYTYTDARIASGAGTGLQLSTVPFSVAQFGIGYRSGGWQVNLFANYNSGARRALFTPSGISPTEFSPSFLNLDLTARLPLTQALGLVVSLENLADVTYEKVNRIYQPGLTVRIGIQAGF
jgi:vitamin B12 transporter